ncbi:site-specific DNA-methyltransferase [Sphingomonas profundi]|uniref:site-specific DNA-methyltransferase n=1 Tax=Alterirhizorhabdus profundi TaxID=2681549 RepID=UPI0012E7A8A7|nr:DNA methyltransferase [Sphingomonas profundi]
MSNDKRKFNAHPGIVHLPVEGLRPHPTNPRVHKPKQIRQLTDSIKRFGFTNPILIDGESNILAGHGRLAAAKLAGLKTVPTICLAGLTQAEKRAYIIADNKLGDSSSFDRKLLAQEVSFILETEPDFDIELTGFELNDLDLMLDAGMQAPARQKPIPPPERDRPACSRPGDLWILGEHKLYCGDALKPESFKRLLGRERARMIFVDPPYNQPAKAITGKGRVRHDDFAMAAGEMSEAEFVAFLTTACTLMAKASVDGALHYICMDWHHQFELLTAGRAVFDDLLNICVWAKAAPGMGSFYRSQHEFVGIFKRGRRPHCNNIELGKHGRNRSNLWSYTSGSSLSPARQEELSWHATVKPVAMVQDALLDASRRNDLILDGFGGSGTTLIAAERCGRRARMIELDPYYCDVIIRRFEKESGLKAVADNGDTLTDRSMLTDGDASRGAIDHG